MRVPCTKVLSQSTLVFLHYPTDLDEPVTSVFLISQHRKSYKPSKNGDICASDLDFFEIEPLCMEPSICVLKLNVIVVIRLSVWIIALRFEEVADLHG